MDNIIFCVFDDSDKDTYVDVLPRFFARDATATSTSKASDPRVVGVYRMHAKAPTGTPKPGPGRPRKDARRPFVYYLFGSIMFHGFTKCMS